MSVLGGRRRMAWVSLGGGVLTLFAAVLSLVAGVGLIAAAGGGPTAAPTPLTVGQAQPVGQAQAEQGAGSLEVVVYGPESASTAVEGSVTLAMDCVVLTPSGDERLRLGGGPAAVLETADGPAYPLVLGSGARVGDSVLCRGEQAAAAGPLLLGVAAGSGVTGGLTGGVVAVGFGVVALLVGIAFLVAGLALRASTRP